MIQSIVTDRKVLSKKCFLVTEGEDISLILQDLKDTFEPLKKKGFGLAANQIGYNRAITYFIYAEKEYTLINPSIIDKAAPICFNEACFSFSGMHIKTRRFNYIKIRHGLDNKEEEFTGLLAVVIQHEIDHLNGFTIFDRKWTAKN